MSHPLIRAITRRLWIHFLHIFGPRAPAKLPKLSPPLVGAGPRRRQIAARDRPAATHNRRARPARGDATSPRGPRANNLRDSRPQALIITIINIMAIYAMTFDDAHRVHGHER